MSEPAPLVRHYVGPLRYLQGPGALDLLGEVVRPYGPTPAVITDAVVRRLLGARVDASLAAAGLRPAVRELPGEITAAAADTLAASLAPETGIVVGIGGGKALDAAKAVALRLGRPVVTVPTAASNDSPTSGAVAMYDEHHRMVGVDLLPANPHTVVVDTSVVAAAPTAFLRAGIGDAIAKRFEAAGCWAGTGTTTAGSRPLRIGGVLADACYAVLLEHGVAGLAACDRGDPDDAFEAVVEAVVLLSGLGFENGGLSLAHSLTRGLMAARGASSAPHGHHVAWGALVQVVAEGRPAAEVAELRDFLLAVDLPVSLAALGLTDPSPAELDELVRLTLAAPHLANLPAPLGADDVRAAIVAVEEGIQPGKPGTPE